MKRVLFLMMLAAALMLLSGCNLIGHDDVLDNNQVVAKGNNVSVTKGEWSEYRDYIASYYSSYYGMNVDKTYFTDSALQELIESKVVENKMTELGITPLSEEDTKDVETYADSMLNLYKQMLRYQNYPDVETVEEEAARLAEEKEAAEATESPAEEESPAPEAEVAEAEATAAPEETPVPEETVAAAAEETPAVEEVAADATEAPKATMTDAELDEKLTADLATMGYTRDYFIQTRTSSVENDKLKEYVYNEKGVEVTDDEVKTEYETKAAEQKEKFDADPTQYAATVSSKSYVYYIPEGYRGIKNLLIKFTDDDQKKIDDLQTKVDDAQSAIDDANEQITTLQGDDASKVDAETADQIATLQNTVTEQTKVRDDAQAELDAAMKTAYEAIKPAAEAALERAKNGESFDALIEELGQDDGMKSDPAKTEGYPVCAGLTTYVTEFQDAAMALEKAGDISDLVATKYGYHILQYATDIASGEQEMTDAQADSLRSSLLTTKQDAAYEAAVNEWVQAADVKETGIKL